MGHCRYCGHRAGWFRSSHRRCAATYRQGLAQLVDLVVAASGQPDFTQRRMLRILDALAQQCYVPADYLPAVLAAGWHLSDLNRMVDDVLTRSETARLREFRDGQHPASQTPGDPGASILAEAARAALATRQRSQRIERVSNLLQRSSLSREESRALLLPAWETAVARQLGDVGIDLDREAALLYYARHFDLDDGELDHHGMLRQFVQGAAIAEAAAGLVPQRMNFPQGAPASALLRRSEQLVWLFDDVECCLGQLPPEPATTITGVAAPDRDLPYYRPQSFVDRPALDQGWESVARGQLAVASQHLHFRGPSLNGPSLSIRLAYGSVVHWEPYHDGIGAVPRAQPNRLVVFRLASEGGPSSPDPRRANARLPYRTAALANRLRVRVCAFRSSGMLAVVIGLLRAPYSFPNLLIFSPILPTDVNRLLIRHRNCPPGAWGCARRQG